MASASVAYCDPVTGLALFRRGRTVCRGGHRTGQGQDERRRRDRRQGGPRQVDRRPGARRPAGCGPRARQQPAAPRPHVPARPGESRPAYPSSGSMTNNKSPALHGRSRLDQDFPDAAGPPAITAISIFMASMTPNVSLRFTVCPAREVDFEHPPRHGRADVGRVVFFRLRAGDDPAFHRFVPDRHFPVLTVQLEPDAPRAVGPGFADAQQLDDEGLARLNLHRRLLAGPEAVERLACPGATCRSRPGDVPRTLCTLADTRRTR